MDRGLSFSVRLATHKDVPVIASLYIKALKELSNLLPEGFGRGLKEPTDFEEEMEYFTYILDDPDVILFVAEERAKIIGFIMGIISREPDDLLSPPYLRLQYLYVDEAFRGLGVAKALIKKLENWVLENGINIVELRVWNTNTPARTLYQSLGYKPLEFRMVKILRAESPGNTSPKE